MRVYSLPLPSPSPPPRPPTPRLIHMPLHDVSSFGTRILTHNLAGRSDSRRFSRDWRITATWDCLRAGICPPSPLLAILLIMAQLIR
ncbi:unnamed protein product [Periconia digitata]|uniref:Uncharacterized protein n=1 Tax=Periconia digitata TaxID=1303443 RepID=A0A9W4UQZ3_9PLEO|nr:unnamed protein product [Periconia digitata]